MLGSPLYLCSRHLFGAVFVLDLFGAAVAAILTTPHRRRHAPLLIFSFPHINVNGRPK